MFEKCGSSTHKGKMDDVLPIDTTSSRSTGNNITVSTLLMDFPSVPTTTLTETIFPTETLVEAGETDKLAACAVTKNSKIKKQEKKVGTTNASILFL